MNRKIINSLFFLIVIGALYRIIPGRPMGFAPQIAMALFGGSIFVNEKKWAFSLPLFSMFIGDCFYQILYLNNMSQISGFYSGQWVNYILFGLLTCFGFSIKTLKMSSILPWSFFAPTFYFLSSNALVWMGGGGYGRPTLLQTYVDGLPFYFNSIYATVFFSVLLFSGLKLITKTQQKYNYE
jgi:hypothetical protein